MAAGWYLGRAVERFQDSPRERKATEPAMPQQEISHVTEDRQRKYARRSDCGTPNAIVNQHHPEAAAISDAESGDPREGFSLETALDAFVSACKQPDRKTLFITDHWIIPRFERLRARLSDPITAEQAQALCDAIEKRVTLDSVIDWLENSKHPWPIYLGTEREIAATRENREKRQEEGKRRRMIEEGRRLQIANVGTFDGRMIAGVPIALIPKSVLGYANFVTWWNEVGRQNPTDPQGWSSISGPGVMWSRSEMIAPEVWESMPTAERQLIEAWAQTIPVGILYD